MFVIIAAVVVVVVVISGSAGTIAGAGVRVYQPYFENDINVYGNM